MIDIKLVLDLHLKWLMGDKEGKRADLHGADLSRADLHGANLRRADLSRADLHGADLSRADLHGANLRRADLHGANLRGADLSRADLSRADLHGANLRRADLHGADLSGANLRYVKSSVRLFNFLVFKFNAFLIDDILTIGCKSFTLDKWLDCGQELGIEENFTQEEIDLILGIIKVLKDSSRKEKIIDSDIYFEI